MEAVKGIVVVRVKEMVREKVSFFRAIAFISPPDSGGFLFPIR